MIIISQQPGDTATRIYVTNVLVDDQAAGLDFYANKLGFQVKYDMPIGKHRWLTLVSSEQPEGTQLLLEPDDHPAASSYKSALVADGIPYTSFEVDDLDKEHKRLIALGVEFTQPPIEAGDVKMAILNDNCGNLIQLIELLAVNAQ